MYVFRQIFGNIGESRKSNRGGGIEQRTNTRICVNVPFRKRPMGIEANSRGRCRRSKLSRMIPNETHEEISNRARQPSLTISCKVGVIAGREEATEEAERRRGRGCRRRRGPGRRETGARNKTSSEARV